MKRPGLDHPARPSADSAWVRLQTLIAIRWAAAAGQLTAIMVVAFGLRFELPLALSLATVAALAAFNMLLPLRHRHHPHIGATEASLHLAFDVLQLSILLFLTGGLENPFAILMLAPVTVAATILSPLRAAMLVGLTIVCVTILGLNSLPLPGPIGGLPLIHRTAIWTAIVLALGFIALYVARVSREQSRMRDALSEAQAALAQEQQISALGALAAAAAHELGTPLGTIAVVSKELVHDLAPDDDLLEDAKLLLSQAERCREILAELARRPAGDSGEEYYMAPLSTLIEAAAAPHRREAVAFVVVKKPDGDGAAGREPRVPRRPEMQHGLGNLLSNAIQFANTRVDVTLAWTHETVVVTIEDDGPGFPQVLLTRLGEPYLSTRRASGGHMGLGVFIARTLLQRIGARLTFRNGVPNGAVVVVQWRRNELEDET